MSPIPFGRGESRYVAKEDLGNRSAVLTISHFCEETLKGERGDEDKWVMYFVNRTKGLVLNIGAMQLLMELFGDPASNTPEALEAQYGGKQIEMYVDPNVMFGKKRVGGLRLRPAPATPQAAADLAPPAPDPAAGDNPAHAPEPPMPESDHAPTAQESDIPF